MQQRCLVIQANEILNATWNGENSYVSLTPTSMPTNNMWKGTHGTVMEIHEVKFIFDFSGVYPTPPNVYNSDKCQFGYWTGGYFQRAPAQTPADPAGTLLECELTHTCMLRMESPSGTTKFPDEQGPHVIARGYRTTHCVGVQSPTSDTSVYPFQINCMEDGMSWNFRDGVGNGLRVAGNELTLHWRMTDPYNRATIQASNRILRPPFSNAAVNPLKAPPMKLYCHILYKWRDVDMYEWTRLAEAAVDNLPS